MLIFIGDEDRAAAETLRGWLLEAGHKPVVFTCPEDLAGAVNTLRPELVFLEMAFRGGQGDKMCGELSAPRPGAGAAVILMSGLRKDAADIAGGIECGAEDYLLKPLDRRLVLARVNSVAQRLAAGRGADTEIAPGLSVDHAARRVNSGSAAIKLTRIEFDLLDYILKRPGQVLTARQLLESVWGYGTNAYNDPATVQVHISRLRKKLGQAFSDKLATLVNIGYRYDA